MQKAIELRLPAPPQRGQRHGHSKWENVKRKPYFELCSLMTSKAVMQNAKIFPLLYCIYDVHIEVGWNLYDSDNLVALLKWPIDWLKYRGLIKDDGPKRFWPVQFPTQAMVARKNRFVYFWLYTSSQIELSRMYARKGLLP